MNVSDNGEVSFPTDLPQFCERITVKNADSGIVCLRIEIVVVDDGLYFTPAIPLKAEEKSARFVLPPTPSAKFSEQLCPQSFRAAYSMFRREQRP
jgi:hypothetical protein